MRAVLEQMLACLDLKLAPPARGVWESCNPVELLASEAVARLELVGETPFFFIIVFLFVSSYCIRPLLIMASVYIHGHF